MLDPLRILGSAAVSSGVRGGIEGSPGGHSLLKSPRQVKGMETQRQEQRWARTVTRSCVCVCVYPPTSTQSFTPMFVHVHVFILFSLLGVFFLFSSFPSLQLISFPSFLLSLASTVLPPSFLFLFSLRLCLSVFISVFSSPASPSATLPCIPQYLFLCLSS